MHVEHLDTNKHSPLSLRGVSLLESYGFFDFHSLAPRVLQANHKDWGVVVIKQAESIKHRFFLKNEADFLAQHPSEYWPKYYDYFSAKGIDYLITQYLDGIPLSSVSSLTCLDLNKADEGSEPRLGNIKAIEVALNTMHRTGYIHGDIKPSNIICSVDNSIKLVDFGTVKKMGRQLNNERFHSYTASFASPNSARGDSKVTSLDDWYSLAVTLTHLYKSHEGNFNLPSRYSLIIQNAQKSG